VLKYLVKYKRYGNVFNKSFITSREYYQKMGIIGLILGGVVKVKARQGTFFFNGTPQRVITPEEKI